MRIGRIVVPLDGSETAEAALPMARSLADGLGASVELVHVHGVTYGGGRDPIEADVLQKARGYLEEKARELAGTSALSVDTALREGPVAPAIMEGLGDRADGIVVMTTHGRSGFSRFWLGSVAERLVRSSPWPVLLVRPRPESGPVDAIDRILVALDGSDRSARGLPWARAIADAVGAAMVLLRVVAHDDERQAASGELDRLADAGEETFVAVHDSAVKGILEQARGRGSPLVVLTTQGRGAVARNILGSVADKVIRSAEAPLLVLSASGRD